MICTDCGARAARPMSKPGPTPTLCTVCAPTRRSTTRLADKLAQTSMRVAMRSEGDEAYIRRLPRDFCRCAVPVPRTEGPLTVCGMCSREVA